MSNLPATQNNQVVDLAPDIIPVFKWDELIQQAEKTGVVNYGGGSSLIAGAFQSPNFKSGSAGWRLDSNGDLEANDGVFRGALSASTIDIGGSDATSFHVDINGNMWLGDASFASAPAKISNAGAATFSNVSVTGGSITGTPIASIPNNSSTDISLLGFSQNLVFSSSDADTVAWTTGTIVLSNGRSFSIDAGNTGNMTALTYIYLDTAVSSTVLQITTTYSTAQGANKIIVAVAQNHSISASVIPYGGGQPLIDGSTQINALSIVAANIAASTITAGKLTVSQLSAITADMGSITAGTIVLPSGGFVRSGQTAYDTGTGFYIGNDSSTPKFSIGNSSGQKVTWDGSTLSIVGNQNVSTVFTAGEAISAGNALYIATAGSDATLSQTTDSSTTTSSDTTDWLGQTFPAGTNPNELTNVKFKLSTSGSPTGNLYVGLYATSGGLPTSQLFTSANVNITTLTGTPTLTTFTFTNTPLEPGVTYAAILKTDNITYSGGTIVFQTDGVSNSYANGQHVATTDGSTWSAPNAGATDLVFEINIEGTIAGRVYKTDATTSTETTTWIGFANASAAKAASVAVVTDGILTGLSGLTIGSQYYLSDTQGAIATSAGTNSRKVGMAITTTALIIRQDNP